MNEYHRRAIAITFHQIDGRLAEIEAILSAVGSESPFSAYALDIEPLARHSVTGYLQRLREKMWSAVKHLQISRDGHRTSATWAIRCAMIGVMVDLANIEPERLGGYGALQPEATKMLSGISADLRRLSNSLLSYLAQSRGEDLAQRLARLTDAPLGDDALLKLEGIITRYGLVELRPILEHIVARLESPDMEVAFFGRVSSGKSSLLNYLLGKKILPVGVLPVTAALTRLRHAEEAELLVRFEISESQRLPLDRIGEFVTEEGNPGNKRRVTEVEVRLPNPCLAEGVVFIDTPGVGSLATFGAAQTKAYLPRCDLGILLVDAGSAMNNEDIALLHGFFEAAIPVTVLISKSDLLNAADRHRIADYTKQVILKELGNEVPVYPVSSRLPHAKLTDHWFNKAILPHMQRHREFAEQSIRRKIARLEELAASYIETMMRLSGGTTPQNSGKSLEQAEALLADADDRIAAVVELTTKPVDAGLPGVIDGIIHHAAKEGASPATKGPFRSNALVVSTLRAMTETAEASRLQLEELTRGLGEILRKISAVCGAPNNSTLMNEVVAGFTPLPRADETQLADIPEVRNTRVFSWWPAFALRINRRRIMQQGYWAVWSALGDHRRKVRAWLTDKLDNICQVYESYAALFRDQLRDAGEGRVGIEKFEQAQADLTLLRGSSAMFQESTPPRVARKNSAGDV
jgi:GTP-binding protein EngB required for normal cell division